MTGDLLTPKRFLEYLRDGLNHLHDLEYLRKSNLISLLHEPGKVDDPENLQKILIDSIQALEPKADESPSSKNWQLFEPLYFRYIQGLKQFEVANQMNISTRHVRRKQNAALENLAYSLWEQFDLSSKRLNQESAGEISSEDTELSWLKNLPNSTTDLNQTLPAVLELIRPLATQHKTQLEISNKDLLPLISVHPVAFQQLLLNILTVFIPQHRGSAVNIEVRNHWQDVEIAFKFPALPGPTSSPHYSSDDDHNLEMAHRLTNLCGGNLTISEDKDFYTAKITFRGIELITVMVVDDNLDTLQLLQRYSAGTPYHIISVQDPKQTFENIKEYSPQIIILDVMMPQIVGWELLGHLRNHPETEHISVLVYTILAQEKLALSLGANGFIQKPITKQGLLEALDHQVELLATKSH